MGFIFSCVHCAPQEEVLTLNSIAHSYVFVSYVHFPTVSVVQPIVLVHQLAVSFHTVSCARLVPYMRRVS